VHQIVGGDFTPSSDVRIGVVAFIRNLGTTSGSITIDIDVLDVSTGLSYGLEAVTMAKSGAYGGNMAGRFDPRIDTLIPAGKKARFRMWSSSAQDTAVNYDFYIYDASSIGADSASQIAAAVWNKLRVDHTQRPSDPSRPPVVMPQFGTSFVSTTQRPGASARGLPAFRAT
jgi:hypothetical protein